jgi:A/G-specific adenine glycosylase
MIFSKALIQWYLQNKRDLLGEILPIHTIWLSEIMYNKRVAQGMPYFLSFTTAFPTVLISLRQVKNKC